MYGVETRENPVDGAGVVAAVVVAEVALEGSVLSHWPGDPRPGEPTSSGGREAS